MSTSALIRINDNDENVVVLYKNWDGYVSALGKQLADALMVHDCKKETIDNPVVRIRMGSEHREYIDMDSCGFTDAETEILMDDRPLIVAGDYFKRVPYANDAINGWGHNGARDFACELIHDLKRSAGDLYIANDEYTAQYEYTLDFKHKDNGIIGVAAVNPDVMVKCDSKTIFIGGRDAFLVWVDEYND